MKKIDIKGTNEALYYKKLNNGMEIYMVPKNNTTDFYVSFTTKYGGAHNSFMPRNKKNVENMPKGIAHFLEHKMFETKDSIDPFTFFAKSGTYCNAFTSYYNTSYLFNGNSNLEENLKYLIHFVQNPYFTDKNIEKEKGIIEQEITMYEDRPDRIIYEKLLYNTFINNPIKFSIAGTVKDINSITKDNLYECYNNFYDPSNMFLTITGNFDKDVISSLTSEFDNKDKKKEGKAIFSKFDEPDTVNKKYEETKSNVEIPYFSVAIKIPLGPFKGISATKRDIYTSLIFKCLFGPTSSFNEEVTNKGLINSPLGIETMNAVTHNIAILSGKSHRVKELIERIKEEIKNISIDEEFIERRKKVLKSSLIYNYEDISAINRAIIDDVIIYGKFQDSLYNEIMSLNKKELDKIIEKLNLKNISVFVINPN